MVFVINCLLFQKKEGIANFLIIHYTYESLVTLENYRQSIAYVLP
jgi:hypothetical protein